MCAEPACDILVNVLSLSFPSGERLRLQGRHVELRNNCHRVGHRSSALPQIPANESNGCRGDWPGSLVLPNMLIFLLDLWELAEECSQMEGWLMFSCPELAEVAQCPALWLRAELGRFSALPLRERDSLRSPCRVWECIGGLLHLQMDCRLLFSLNKDSVYHFQPAHSVCCCGSSEMNESQCLEAAYTLGLFPGFCCSSICSTSETVTAF